MFGKYGHHHDLRTFLRFGHPVEAVHDCFYAVLVDQRFQPNLDLPALLLRLFIPFDFPFDVSQRLGPADLDAHRFRQRRHALAHVAFQRQTGIGFDEVIPRRTGSPAETAFAVLLAIDRVDVPAGAFGWRVIAGPDRHVFVVQLVGHHADARARRIDAAVFRLGGKRRARPFAGATAPALVYFALN